MPNPKNSRDNEVKRNGIPYIISRTKVDAKVM